MNQFQPPSNSGAMLLMRIFTIAWPLLMIGGCLVSRQIPYVGAERINDDWYYVNNRYHVEASDLAAASEARGNSAALFVTMVYGVAMVVLVVIHKTRRESS